jgi:hypothetical protein
VTIIIAPTPPVYSAEHCPKRISFRTWDVAYLRYIAPYQLAQQEVKLESTISTDHPDCE